MINLLKLYSYATISDVYEELKEKKPEALDYFVYHYSIDCKVFSDNVYQTVDEKFGEKIRKTLSYVSTHVYKNLDAVKSLEDRVYEFDLGLLKLSSLNEALLSLKADTLITPVALATLPILQMFIEKYNCPQYESTVKLVLDHLESHPEYKIEADALLKQLGYKAK